MKVPDKIYFYKGVLGSPNVSYRNVEGVETIEYIRKDVLLEWLNGMVYEYNVDRFDDGFNTALGQVIDKLNLM